MKNYVKAVVSFVFLTMAVAMFPVMSQAAVTAPTNLRQTNAGTGSVEVSWQAVPDAERYWVQWSLDGVTWGTKGEETTSADETLYSLSAGSTYYVRVGASEGGWLSDITDVPANAWSAPIEVVTVPDYTHITNVNVNIGAVTSNSLPFTWTACPGASFYNVYNESTNELIGTTAVPAFTWNGLIPGSSYRIDIQPVRVSSLGYEAKSSATYSRKTSPLFYTRPEKPVTPTVGAFGLGSTYYNINKAYFAASVPTGYAGYEIEVYTVKGNKMALTTSSTLSGLEVKRNTAYKYRCRFYNNYEGERIYGDWSGYRYFWFHSVKGQRVNGKKIKLSWGKVTNAKNYTIYISTSSTGGYKKVKTVKAKTTKLTITKCGKKKINRKKKYYVKIVAKAKDGKKVISSDVNWSGETLG